MFADLAKAFLLSPAGLSIIGAAGLGLIALGTKKAIELFASNPKLQPLEPIAQDAGDFLTDAEKAVMADLAAGKKNAAAADVLAIAKADFARDLPDMESAVQSEIKVLTQGPVKLTVTAPGGAAVNLPDTSKRGVVGLVVVLIIGGVILLGGAIGLLATGHAAQDVSCLETAVTGNPTAVGNLVSGLSKNDDATVESALGSFEPTLGKCILVSLWQDVEAAKAAKTATKVGATPVASTGDIQAAAQTQSVKREWYPAGTVAVVK